jgi:hypothetical protein
MQASRAGPDNVLITLNPSGKSRCIGLAESHMLGLHYWRNNWSIIRIFSLPSKLAVFLSISGWFSQFHAVLLDKPAR